MIDDAELATFIAEARELLEGMDAGLLRLERSPTDAGALNEIFRAAHTIKGSAGLFGLDGLVGFAHAMENLLASIRAGELAADPALVALLLSCRDHCGARIDAIAAGEGEHGAALQAVGASLAERLEHLAPGHQQAETAHEHRPVTLWRILARFGADVLRHGLDPIVLVRHLRTLGEITSITPVFDAMPDAAGMDPERCYLAFAIELRGPVDEATLASSFDFVRDDCDLRIEPAAPRGPIGPDSATEQDSPRSVKAQSELVKVRGGKLDELINLVGELVIASSAVSANARRKGDTDTREAAGALERLVEQVRDTALRLRMVPIGQTFNRFARVVRDLGRELDKPVDLEVSGGDTELDKFMVDRIADPLLHLVRNAMDHGIEPPRERELAGKPARGKVRLNAYPEAGSIVVEVEDDGRGLDRRRIVDRAVALGLAATEDAVGDRELLRLVSEPGLSTADRVTNLSGRGVGMDVVRRNVEALRGTVALDSREGRGTRVVLRLPLTLAIIDGFAVSVGDSALVLPLEAVEECIELRSLDNAAIRESGYLNLRDEVLPVLRMRDVFCARGDGSRRESVVVVNCDGERAGFVVDRLLGELQTVIKPLGPLFRQLSGISGSTILGTGEVALIVDVQALVERAAAQARQQR